MCRAPPDTAELGPAWNAPPDARFVHAIPDPLLSTVLEESHPQAQLPARGSGGNPLLRGVELGHGRHGTNACAAELGQLVAVRGVNIDEAVHVADTEAVDRIRGVELPLGSETARR